MCASVRLVRASLVGAGVVLVGAGVVRASLMFVNASSVGAVLHAVCVDELCSSRRFRCAR